MRKRLHRVLSLLKHRFIRWTEDKRFLHYLGAYNRRNIYVIGTPTHSNVGDNAIVLAEMLFLESCGIPSKRIKEITVDEYKRFEKLIVKRLPGKKRLICMHGGGNMGNQWPDEELFRRNTMAQLAENPMIILPQTFYYSNDEDGAKECEKSVSYYNGRKSLTIVARERTSFELMKKCYPDTNILLTPDIVLSMDPKALQIHQKKRQGALLVFRQDGEKVLPDDEIRSIMKTMEDMGLHHRSTDMITTHQVQKDNRRMLILEKLDEFLESEIVVTDRLHAMVFAAISGTPCIALKNNNHKITGTYEWIKELPYIQFADDLDQAKTMLAKLHNEEQYSYDHTAFSDQFNGLREVINQPMLQGRSGRKEGEIDAVH